ncbi:hypothetical protein Glove_241g31 [Diversispora epigaea]|uniref:DUF659 domain-containing protein n=1 Tax=Diversispora epigaea TaxID=1348612 RepID=A0A397II24_9GLOM|nr:hypothetical protein Glove_241g31 [Diversispora epigaea]
MSMEAEMGFANSEGHRMFMEAEMGFADLEGRSVKLGSWVREDVCRSRNGFRGPGERRARGFIRMSVEVEMDFTDLGKCTVKLGSWVHEDVRGSRNGLREPGDNYVREFVRMFVEVEMDFANSQEWYEMCNEHGKLTLNKILIATQGLYRIVIVKGIIGLIVLPEENKVNFLISKILQILKIKISIGTVILKSIVCEVEFFKDKMLPGAFISEATVLSLYNISLYYSKDELLISTSNRKHSRRLKNKVWTACKFCKQKWSCRKTSEMIAHLALQCPKSPPPEVHALYLKILNNRSFDDNDDDNFSKRSKPYKQSKITNHVERLTVTDDKQRRCSRALTKFFVTCGVPLWIVENLFFIDYSKELCPGFQVLKRTILSTTMINVETATVIAEMKKKLSNETNLTLSLNGWTSPAGQSLYIFLIMTIIEEVGAEKFCSIVSDHASNVVLAKNLVSIKYPHIFPIQCIAHHINLLSNDIIKLNWATNIITCYKKIVTFFKQSYAAYDCTDSIIRCKNALKQQNFFKNVKDLRTILLPIKKAIINLKHKSTTLADCFINLVIMATAIKELSQTSNQNFSKEYTGLQINTFRIICEKALSIWKLLRGREKSANELIAQILNYSLKSKPYDFEFVTRIHTVKNWWLMCKQQNNHIQKLALLMASIVPSNASYERYFSVLG